MARNIRKKVVDEDISFADNFDEALLEKMERDFDKLCAHSDSGEPTEPIPGPGERESGRKMTGADLNVKDENEGGSDQPRNGMEADTQDYSLDDFCDFQEQETSGEVDAGDSECDGGSLSGKQSADESSVQHQPSEAKRTVARNKALLIASTAFVVLVACVIFLAQWFRGEPERRQALNIVIRHPVPIERYHEQFGFLYFVNADQEKALVSLNMEFQFPAENAHIDFQKNNSTYRDAIYQFLQQQSPPESSGKSSRGSLEKELLSFIKATFPGCGVQNLRITQLRKL